MDLSLQKVRTLVIASLLLISLTTALATAASIKGDFTGDGKVDATDLQVLIRNYSLPGDVTKGDISGNNFIGAYDLSQLLSVLYINQQQPTPTATEKLRWTPPGYDATTGKIADSYVRKTIPADYNGVVVLDGNTDYLITLDPAARDRGLYIQGGRNLVIMGGMGKNSAKDPATGEEVTNRNRGLYIYDLDSDAKDSKGNIIHASCQPDAAGKVYQRTIHVEGFQFEGNAGSVSYDGIDAGSKCATVQIQNVRIMHLIGSEKNTWRMDGNPATGWGVIGTDNFLNNGGLSYISGAPATPSVVLQRQSNGDYKATAASGHPVGELALIKKVDTKTGATYYTDKDNNTIDILRDQAFMKSYKAYPLRNDHADIIQPIKGFNALRIDRLTGSSTYQGLYLDTDGTDDTHIKDIDISNVNLAYEDINNTALYSSSNPNAKDRNEGGFLFWLTSINPPNACALPTVNLSEFYIVPGVRNTIANTVKPDTNANKFESDGKTINLTAQCHSQLSGTSISWPGTTVIGSIKTGTPPVSGNEFVPARKDGEPYVSPGYK